MPKPKIIDMVFPFGGVHRRSGFQKQPPYTCTDALNVRPFDAMQQRLRGGSRPGLIKTHYTQLGSGNPVRMLNGVTVVQQNGLTFWTDNFDAPAMSSVWSAASWISASMPSILPDNVSSVSYNNAGGAVRSALSDLDTAQDYQIELFINPYNGYHQGTYQIFLRMDNSAPAATTAGVVCELLMQDNTGTYSGSLKYYTGSVLTTTVLFTNGSTGQAQPGWFRVFVSGNDISCYWLENQLLAATTVGAAAGARFGFGIEANFPANGGICLADIFRIQYKTTNNNQAYRRLLVASSNGSLYREKELNTFEVVASARTLASDRLLQSAERFQKLYIADNGNPRITGTTTGGTVNGTTFDSNAVADWSIYGIDPDDDVVVITNPTGGVVAGTYEISAVAAGSVMLSTSSGTAGNCDFRIERCPKIYDPAANTLTRWVATSGSGSVPSGCPLITTYRDRLVLAGPPNAPHAFFAGKQGDPLDWNYGASAADATRAVAGTSVETGLLGEPIKAIIQGGDDFLIWGMENSIARLEGDWNYGGQNKYLSRTIGVVDKQAWCFGPSHEIVFLSRDGLYMMPPGGGNPQSISREKLPNELLRLDNTLYYIQLNYDVQDRGIHIFVTPTNGSGQLHWWFDWETKSFWPVALYGPSLTSMVYNFDPTASMYFSASCASDTAALLGCRDGYVRRFSNASCANYDDVTSFTSYVDYGPVRLGDDYRDGMLNELIAVLGQGTKQGVTGTYGANTLTPITWSLYVGAGNEQSTIATTAFTTGSWDLEGLNYKHRPRMRGNAFRLRVTGSTAKWALEKVTAVLEPVGAQRK